MIIIEHKIKIEDLIEGYRDDSLKDGGVYAYDNIDHRLIVRPSYQREFCYGSEQRDKVIDSILKGYPLNIMYWAKTSDYEYELIDGQQRTISICQYATGAFSVMVNGILRSFTELQQVAPDLADKFLNYELTVYICEGDAAEKLEWFRTINQGTAQLTNQELLNAVYASPFVTDARALFSKPAAANQALSIGSGYITGKPIRQEILEKVLYWHADATINIPDSSKKSMSSKIEAYLQFHLNDRSASALNTYYRKVIAWAKKLFTKPIHKITDVQEWGILYNEYGAQDYDTKELADSLNRLLEDDEVTNKKGIIPYLLSDRTESDERSLSIREFSDSIKRKVYKKQAGQCPWCVKNGNFKTYAIEEMEGDHITPWSQGGKSTEDNCQMLCKMHNRKKSAD